MKRRTYDVFIRAVPKVILDNSVGIPKHCKKQRNKLKEESTPLNSILIQSATLDFGKVPCNHKLSITRNNQILISTLLSRIESDNQINKQKRTKQRKKSTSQE